MPLPGKTQVIGGALLARHVEVQGVDAAITAEGSDLACLQVLDAAAPPAKDDPVATVTKFTNGAQRASDPGDLEV